MAVDEKVLQEKLDKGETLNKEEEQFLLSDEPAVEGFKPTLSEDAKTPEEKPVEEKKPEEEKPKEEAKKPEAKLEEKPPEDVSADVFAKLETELAKPEGKENLEGWSKTEKAYYYQMRRDRKARQQAESDRDAALFRETKLKTESKTKEEAAPTPLDDLKKKDPTDFMTVADVLKVVEAISKTPEVKKEETRATVDPVRLRFLKMCEDEARVAHPDDYDAVLELTDEIIMTDEKRLVEVAMAMNAGENPALKAYELIKSHPDFEKLFPVAQAKVKGRKEAAKKPEEKKKDKEEEKKPAKSSAEIEKEKKALEAQEALEKNKNKKKTTGHLETGSGTEDGEPSIEEMSNMSDRQFAKLPKKTRQKYLEIMRNV